MGIALGAGCLGGLADAPAALLAEAPVDPGFAALAVAERLADLGARTAGSDAHRQAQRLLVEEMERAGLADVSRLEAAGGVVNLSGVLRGEGGQQIVLSANYDTGSTGLATADNAAGCAVVLSAAADLSRTPRRHTLRVVLFDGKQAGLSGSRAWLGGLSTVARNSFLAHLELDLPGNGDGRRVLHLLPVRRGGRRQVAPGWLAHAVLEGMDAAGERPVVSAPALPLMAQLAVRLTGWSRAADSTTFAQRGVPSVMLSDRGLTRRAADRSRPVPRFDDGRLQEWSRGVAAAVRRLDGLAGRPLEESEFLVVLGRVWLRRDLYWLGFVIWCLLVWRGLPGRRRDVPPDTVRRRSSTHFPGFLFRMLFLVAVFGAPAFGIPLLLPAALIVLLRPRRPPARAAGLAVGLLPVAVLAVFLLLLLREDLGALEIAWTPALLVASTLLSFAVWMVVLQHRDAGG